MNEGKMGVWLTEVWQKREGALRKHKSVLLLDAFEGSPLFSGPPLQPRQFNPHIAHRTDSVKEHILRENGLLVVFPGGTTSKLQPLDVLINRAFKKEMKTLWGEWMMRHRQDKTAAGNIKPPSRGEVATWVKEAWDKIPESLVRTAFAKAGFPNIDAGDERVEEDSNFEDCPLFQEPPECLPYDDDVELDFSSLSFE